MTDGLPDLDDGVYPGGFYSLVDRFERKQVILTGAADLLPPADADLAALWTRTVPDLTVEEDAAPRFSAQRKYLQLQKLFVGAPEIHLLHALLIAILRRRDPPPAAPALFFRLWREEGDRLATSLPVRWLISAATTLADIGQTGGQRACGMGLSVLDDMIKLHESERRYSGQPADTPFPRRRGQRIRTIAFDLDPYSLEKGDLDRNLLSRLWKLCEDDATIRPLGIRMLRLVTQDRRTVFARMQELKRRDAARRRAEGQPEEPEDSDE